MKHILLKEILELMRDKKALFVAIILPIILFPIILVAMSFFTSQAIEEANTNIQYKVLNAELAPEFLDGLKTQPDLVESDIALTDLRQQILDGDVDMVLEFATQGESIALNVYYDKTNRFSEGTKIVKDQVAAFNERQNLMVLESLGLSSDKAKASIEAIAYQSKTISSTRSFLGEMIGGFLFFIILMNIISAGLALAADVAAGEKERQTLESLLIAPQSRVTVAMGKWLALCAFGIVNSTLTLLSIALLGMFAVNVLDVPEVTAMLNSIPLSSYALALLLLLPLIGFVNAALLAATSFASSFKEAQSNGSFVLIVFMMIGVISMQGLFELSGVYAWIPVLNISLSVIDVIKGEFALSHLLPVLLSNFAVLVLVLAATVGIYKRESVMLAS
ncbi:hypothetical protein CS022_18500 [Veronia nyctiphanis]|uniref:ABC-2 type transporter transmembrane domain-containing protein n=1 Tax=Veronia nyctiphanis TaxID=1278244 RepID=A0A4Q0YMD3_9GAMM|nr:ABC transporter permease [Veronia nyctiphanis]RXJ71990.1 hypothetical protein CS022_18500 [Veronia nyctiphanis]